MSSTAVSLIVLGCVLGGAFLGSVLRSALPKHHVTDESRDAIKVGIGLIATLVALVLGLLIASAKSSFDTKSEEIKVGAAKIIQLDRTLRRLGPMATDARTLLRRSVAFRVQQAWGEENVRSLGDDRAPAPTMDDVLDRIRAFAPTNDSERWLQARALDLGAELSQTRWLLVEQAASSISLPFLVVVVTWLSLIFASIGLLAPPNATVRGVIVACAISVSASVLLILELDRPFQGLITLSKEPLRIALAQLEQGR